MEKSQLRKVMLVEDEDDIRTVAQMALEDIGGFQALCCSSGKQALEEAPKFQPEIILLDVMMPGMDGMTTLKELRKLPDVNKIPIIFLTAKVQSSEIAHYIEIGAIGVINKPFDPMTLASTLQELWEKSRE
jgi:two-component system, OmpR family, response regulator